MNAPADPTDAALKARILAEALPYIQRFHGKTIVVKFGGNAMTDDALKAGFARDVVLLKLVGMNPVVVHGGGPQIEQLLAAARQEGRVRPGHARHRRRDHGRGRDGARRHRSTRRSSTLINQAGGKAVGLTGQDGALHPRAQDAAAGKDNGRAVDIGQVGEIESIDPAIISCARAGRLHPGDGADRRRRRRRPPTTSTPTWSPASWPRSCTPRS